MFGNFNPIRFGIEMIYSIIIAFIFMLLYIKTKKISLISKHKGITLFRYSFLFFSLAYISRVAYHLLRIYIFSSDFFIHGRVMSGVSFIFVIYLSTISIGYLIYSTIWKKIKHWHFLVCINALAILLVYILFFQSLIIAILFQIFLILIILVINYNKKIGILYSLISLFWILNILILFSRNILSFETKVVFQIISMLILSYFSYRVLKWVS
jgi:hypothetical protein